MIRIPDESTATPIGVLNLAEVARPPSPLKVPDVVPVPPLPAIVVIMPLDKVILRIRRFW